MHEMTAANLRSSFGGESMAHMRYKVWADKAEQDGMPNVARLFKATSHSEHVHAWNHFSRLREAPGEALVIAGATFGVGTTVENLTAAATGEGFEIEEMYPAYIQVAELQGERAAARSMKNALLAEEVHKGLFTKALESIADGADAVLGTVQVCDMCGFTLEGDAPDECPVCGAPRSAFIAF